MKLNPPTGHIKKRHHHGLIVPLHPRSQREGDMAVYFKELPQLPQLPCKEGCCLMDNRHIQINTSAHHQEERAAICKQEVSTSFANESSTDAGLIVTFSGVKFAFSPWRLFFVGNLVTFDWLWHSDTQWWRTTSVTLGTKRMPVQWVVKKFQFSTSTCIYRFFFFLFPTYTIHVKHTEPS